MKAFKILDPADGNRMMGYIVANDALHASDTLIAHCEEMDDDYMQDCCEISEMTREEFEAIQLVDETAEPNEDGEYPISPMNYDEEVENVTEAYVIEFDH